MKISRKCAAIALSALAGMASVSKAAALIDLTLQGSTDGGNTWSSNLAVTPGQTVQYQLTGVVAPAGTTNGNAGYTVSGSPQIVGTDGIGGLNNVNLTDAAGQLTAAGTLQSGYNAGTGSSAGSAANGSIADIVALLGTGVSDLGAQTPIVLYAGSFAAGTYSTDAITEALAGSFNAKVLLSTGSTHNFVNASQGADPYVSASTLTLAEGTSPVPEPASLAVFGLGAVGLLARRRKSA